jgi:aspartate carbamoyltransferase catalytic subunit
VRNPRVKRFDHKDLLSMDQLSVQDTGLVLDTAESLKEVPTPPQGQRRGECIPGAKHQDAHEA